MSRRVLTLLLCACLQGAAFAGAADERVLYNGKIFTAEPVHPYAEAVAIRSGSWPVQLLHSDDRQAEPMWSPDSRWIAYSQDKGGNELWDIYVISREGGSPMNLTNTPDIREQHPVWSHDGKIIACAYKPKQAPSYDLAVIDLATHKLRKLTEEKDPQQNWDVIAFGPDNATLYANRTSVGF